MSTINDVMTTTVRSIQPGDTIQSAAQLIASLNVGALPVCEGEQLAGIVSLGDLALRQSSDVGPTLDKISAPASR